MAQVHRLLRPGGLFVDILRHLVYAGCVSQSDLLAIIINACGLGIASMGMIALWLQPRKASVSTNLRALIALLAILAVDTTSSIFDLSPLARSMPQWGGVGYGLWPWMPVCLWAYVDGLTRMGAPPPPGYRRHILVAGAGVLCLLPFLLLPGADKLALARGDLVAKSMHHLLFVAGVLLFVLLWIGHMLVVGGLILRRLAAHRRRMRDLLSDVAAVDLRWLDGLMLFIGTGIAIAIADNLLSMFSGFQLLGIWGSAAFEALVIGGLALFGLNQERAVPPWAEALGEAEAEPEPNAAAAEPRYSRSSLTPEDCAAIIERLDAVMTRDEPWRNPFLNLKMLSERIATKPYYVTQALNTVLSRNFYDYVNGWRVRAAARALAEKDGSVLGICEDVGFNSKSTFNNVFRREMDATPSAYRISARKRAAP